MHALKLCVLLICPGLSTLSLELVRALALDDVKAILVEHLAIQARVCELGFERLARFEGSNTGRCAGQDQVSFLIAPSALCCECVSKTHF